MWKLLIAHGVKVIIKDIFTRMLQMSHPLVAVKERSITCGICGEIGHSGRSKIHHGNDKNANTDDEILKKAFYVTKSKKIPPDDIALGNSYYFFLNFM